MTTERIFFVLSCLLIPGGLLGLTGLGIAVLCFAGIDRLLNCVPLHLQEKEP